MAGTSTPDIKVEKRGLRDNCPKKPDRAAALYRTAPTALHNARYRFHQLS
ncbi:MAG: hypothetical protein K0S02_3649 [Achromobacter mucicolens]|jgi:hypothetical protein|nr:hypothetical protein [Achromobacter mucicolens]